MCVVDLTRRGVTSSVTSCQPVTADVCSVPGCYQHICTESETHCRQHATRQHAPVIGYILTVTTSTINKQLLVPVLLCKLLALVTRIAQSRLKVAVCHTFKKQK